MTVFRATPADFECLQPLYRECAGRSAAEAPDYYRESEQDFSLYTGIIESDEAEILVAEDGGEYVGMMILWRRSRPLSPNIIKKTTLYISSFIAKSEAAADALMERAKAYAECYEIDEMQVFLHNSEARSIDFYKQLGFEPGMTLYSKKLK